MHLPDVDWLILEADKLVRHVTERDAREQSWRKVALKDFERLVAEEDKHGDFLFVDNVDVTASAALNMLHFVAW